MSLTQKNRPLRVIYIFKVSIKSLSQQQDLLLA
jgi:hypothetical protein